MASSESISAIGLADICTDVSYGYTESATSEPVGPKFLRITDIQGGKFDWNAVPYCAASSEAATKYALDIGDIVVARTGNSTGENAQVSHLDGPAVFASYLIRFRVDPKKANPFFVGYQLRTQKFRDYVLGVRGGSAQPGANAKQLGGFPLVLVDRRTQDSAVEFLRVLDDRIDNLRQTNTTLEAIAQAMFKSWFVDFDPVRAKADGREPEGMDAATAALFPSEFEDSELGPIPKGWRVCPLDSIADYLNGLALQKYPPESDAEFLPVIKIAQLRAGHTNGADRASARLKPEYIVEDGDVLFSWSGSLEVEVWCGGRGALNQHLFKVTSTEVPKWFYYFATRLHLPSFRDTAAHKATTMGHIQRRHLTEAKIALPPPDVMEALSAVAAPLFERRIDNALQTRTLTKLRDTLLPRLISGKLRLPEAASADTEA